MLDDKYLIDKLDEIEKDIEALLDREEPTLKYKIETSDKQEHYMAFHGSDFHDTCWELDQKYRKLIKYPEEAEEKGLDTDTIQFCRDLLREYMADHGVDFEHVS